MSAHFSLSQLDAALATRIARLAIDGLHREYPNKLAHVLTSDADARPPRELTPMFFGCFDWHSAVHTHWCLVRLLRCVSDLDCAKEARTALSRSLTPGHAAGELRYLTGPDRVGFERPYGLAWLLQLCGELREWNDDDAREWFAILAPLEQFAAEQFRDWLPKLTHPIRSGEHSQTAFAMGLCWDWCEATGDDALRDLLQERAIHYHADDQNAPLHFEPSGHDFLSPCLASADLMRRILPCEDFRDWLAGLLPQIPNDGLTDWLQPATVTDSSDGKLAHLHGLNLSRGWMLEGVSAALPHDDARIASLQATTAAHRHDGLTAVTGKHYAISHWLGSFATYLLTQRGICADPET